MKANQPFLIFKAAVTEFARCLTTVAALFCLLASASSQANELEPKMDQLCESVKSCAMQQLEGQNIPPEMKGMMQAQFAQMCVPLKNQFSYAEVYPELVNKAGACIDSMNAMSCDQLMSDENNETPECQDYQAYVEKMQEQME